MTDDDYDRVQLFLTRVRKAYRELRLNSDDPEATRNLAQDNLSLFSPWMNNEETTK